MLIMERLSSDRRYKLINRVLLIETCDAGVIIERSLGSADEFRQVIDQTFNMTLPAPAEEIFGRIAVSPSPPIPFKNTPPALLPADRGNLLDAVLLNIFARILPVLEPTCHPARPDQVSPVAGLRYFGFTAA